MPGVRNNKHQHYVITLLILAVGGIGFSLAQTMVILAITEMEKSFGVKTSEVTWVVTANLLVASVATPVIGRLGDMFGKRRFLVFSIAMLTVGSLISAWGTMVESLSITIIGRALQGVSGGIMPLSFGIIRDTFPAGRIPIGIALLGSTTALGGGLGLPLGGIIVDQLSIPWIFWVGAIIAGVVTITAVLFVPESRIRIPGQVDVLGVILLGVGLVFTLLAISQINIWKWNVILPLGIIGIWLLVFLFRFERRRRDPLIDIGTFLQKPVLRTNITTFLLGYGMFGSFMFIPQFLQVPVESGGFSLSATKAGLVVMTAALSNLCISLIAGMASARVGAKYLLIFGCVIAAVSMLLFGYVNESLAEVIAWSILLGVGFGFAFAASPNLIIELVDVHKTGEATGINMIMRNIGSSLGAQIGATIVTYTTVLGLSTNTGFKLAFLVSAVGSAVAALFGLSIPRIRRFNSKEESSF